MKQCITLEQYGELTDKQNESLNKLWVPCIGDIFEYGSIIYAVQGVYDDGATIWAEDNNKFFKEHCNPMFSIGKMIEILGRDLMSCVQYVTPAWTAHYKAKEYVADDFKFFLL